MFCRNANEIGSIVLSFPTSNNNGIICAKSSLLDVLCCREGKGLHQAELVKLSKEAKGLTAAVAELKAEKEKMSSSLHARENN